ncbi:TetR/AcrR family transcriptional regulator C-terminal domain-containing protein [Saccharopolyspora sp. WRP15-2]|uniref:TetR/AcrR family transcriptional regulator C-terminal domain-containing protein n=1 Tax=Saccharopolyspora oryzae TaxID=2997343 RepID=A0ABT4UUR1_9PSEU|nr:TetR/AcrR family transcriptional regulator C-terminal domain-containing protein [Saccharopolyspora oryzae]MDA3625462.1 TetR/AcrR family transcriptional regulator C-terminal domain-containing protein [Saccharopolyspora oryzae]
MNAAKPTGGLVWFDEPPPPPATDQLSRERVVAAAIGLADESSSGEVTMRAIASRLGTRSPMALYRYVGSKDGLTDLMVDEVYGEITVPPPGDWRTCLREMGLSAWAAVQRHPWFARLAFSRPPLGPNALRLYDSALAAVDELGLEAAGRIGFINTVLGQVFGSGLALLEELAMRQRTGLASDAELEEAVRPYLERIKADGEHPHYIRWLDEPDPMAEVVTFEQQLEWQLDGLQRLAETRRGG